VHVDVHEIVRRYKIVFDFPEAWRPLTVRQAVLSIVQTELRGGTRNSVRCPEQATREELSLGCVRRVTGGLAMTCAVLVSPRTPLWVAS
jgi:hypothetical protein